MGSGASCVFIAKAHDAGPGPQVRARLYPTERAKLRLGMVKVPSVRTTQLHGYVTVNVEYTTGGHVI